MRRLALVAMCVCLALVSWYMAGFFSRYELIVGEQRHFGIWARASQLLVVGFAVAAIYAWRNK